MGARRERISLKRADEPIYMKNRPEPKRKQKEPSRERLDPPYFMVSVDEDNEYFTYGGSPVEMKTTDEVFEYIDEIEQEGPEPGFERTIYVYEVKEEEYEIHDKEYVGPIQYSLSEFYRSFMTTVEVKAVISKIILPTDPDRDVILSFASDLTKISDLIERYFEYATPHRPVGFTIDVAESEVKKILSDIRK